MENELYFESDNNFIISYQLKIKTGLFVCTFCWRENKVYFYVIFVFSLLPKSNARICSLFTFLWKMSYVRKWQ